jgi:hypothetical protein
LNLIYLLNVSSRLLLFIVVAYKAYRERSDEWIYMTLAFLLAAFTPERFLLEPLGFHLRPDVAFSLDMVNTLAQGVIAMLAALYVKKMTPEPEERAVPIFIGVLAYFIVVLTSVSELNLGFTTKTVAPLAVYSGGYIYLGYTILRYAIPRDLASELFSIGMISLGALNATYPYTATLTWFRPIGFFFGTIFRFVIALGAIGVVFWPVRRIVTTSKIRSGAFMVLSPSREVLIEEAGELPNPILVTREDLKYIESALSESAMVFWITRVTEGELKKKPAVYAISPTKLGILLDMITRALESGYRAVYVDSVEYMILENGFKTTLKFLLDLKDRVISMGGRMVMRVEPENLTENQLRILKREFEELRGQASR